MKIGFDFDGVLFNADKLKKELDKCYGNYFETYESYKVDGIYDFESHCEELGTSSADFLDKVQNLSKECLYSDVGEVRKLTGEKMIITRGPQKFQEAKIIGSEVLEYFDDYKVVQERSKNFPKLDVLIDDTVEELYNFSGRKIHFDRKFSSMSDIVELLTESKDLDKSFAYR